MSHEVETMAYRLRNSADVPWHGLGVAVTDVTSPSEMLEIARLDWTVSKRMLRVQTSRNDSTLMTIPGQYAIMRDTDHQFYGTCSDRFHLVQNAEVVSFFDSYCQASGGMELDTLGSLRSGAVIWALAKMNQSFILPGGDKVDGYILLCNSHDGSLMYQGFATSVRVVCMNTLRMSFADNKAGNRLFRIKHSNSNRAAIVEDAKRKLQTATRQMEMMEVVSNLLANAKVRSREQVEQFVTRLTAKGKDENGNGMATTTTITGSNILDSVIDSTPQGGTSDMVRAGRHILDAIVQAPGQDIDSARGTWWGVLNGVTYYYDHLAGRGTDTRMQSSWFGVNNVKKLEAAELAIEYAGVDMDKVRSMVQ